ncbi:maleylacetate reductase [Algoriphagus sp.]|uniref:maleylacetate reductase n=1 Tax=Algoriphagus sp. TaxID=1872435 RepID=UPI0025FBA532|nr:maleylacetate reductase [Algoriphagus sp.]
MNIQSFEYKSFPIQVHFGQGTFSKLPELLKESRKAFIIASPRLQNRVKELSTTLSSERIFHFKEVVQHVPSHLVEKALMEQKKHQADILVAIGGGSAVGLAKAMALQLKQPIIAIPSTFSGSEMTNIWGISKDGLKTTGRDSSVLPQDVIYDPELTENMPKDLAVKSAFNALAHLMEAAYAPDTNPITYNNSLLGINKIIEGLDLLKTSEKLTPQANELLLFGAFLAGKGLGEVSMSLHHKTAHTLGGSFGMDHASVHTVIQPYVFAYQWNSLEKSLQNDFQKAYDHEFPPLKVQSLIQELGGPVALKAIGFSEENIKPAVKIMLAKPYANPKPLEEEGLIQMLKQAYSGTL